MTPRPRGSLFRRRRPAVAGRQAFVWLMLAIGTWSLLSDLHTLAPTPALKVAVAKLQYLSIASVPLLWLLVVHRAVGLTPLRHRHVGALAVIPLLIVAAAWTNDWHGWLWAQITPLASTGAVTGLRNRGAFNERLIEEVTRATRHHTPLSLLLIDKMRDLGLTLIGVRRVTSLLRGRPHRQLAPEWYTMVFGLPLALTDMAIGLNLLLSAVVLSAAELCGLMRLLLFPLLLLRATGGS